MKTVTAVIADDHPIVLDGLKKDLEDERIVVIGSLKETDKIVSDLQRLNPDVLVLDLKCWTVSSSHAGLRCSRPTFSPLFEA